MMRRKTGWTEDFQTFLAADAVAPPADLTARVHSAIHSRLNPASGLVFLKILLIHVAVGAITLLFCPQFGFSFTPSMGLMGVLMRFGTGACTFGCGVFFLGSSALMASLLLKPEEITVLRRNELIQLPSLAALSIVIFGLVGELSSMPLTLVWLAGSVLGALATLELAWSLRSRSGRQVIHGA